MSNKDLKIEKEISTRTSGNKENSNISNEYIGNEYIDNDIDIENSCIICFEDLVEDSVAVLECGHYFHYNCVKNWLVKDKCPTCRGGEDIIQIIENNKKPFNFNILNDTSNTIYNDNEYMETDDSDINQTEQPKKKCFRMCSIC